MKKWPNKSYEQAVVVSQESLHKENIASDRHECYFLLIFSDLEQTTSAPVYHNDDTQTYESICLQLHAVSFSVRIGVVDAKHLEWGSTNLSVVGR
jgi:hypothetical protein